ncbi:MAG: shikimate dehydrogenase [Terrimesophilobacter sp.]
MAEHVRRLAVLGSPISHSKSPALHAAAYQVLGIPWNYEAIEVDADGLAQFLKRLDASWRGLSLTMPLKREIIRHLETRDDLVDVVGSANTVVVAGGRLSGFNTDVYGAERMLSEAMPERLTTALILGAGATACSIVVALKRLGAHHATVWARSPGRAAEVSTVAERIGLGVDVVSEVRHVGTVDAVISTLPGAATLSANFPYRLRAEVPLVDIAYDPWPTAVARHWLEAEGAIVNNGMGMLLYQALAQVRIFVGGHQELELPTEAGVLEAMRAAAFGAG